jgi:hypothetical protein
MSKEKHWSTFQNKILNVYNIHPTTGLQKYNLQIERKQNLTPEGLHSHGYSAPGPKNIE